MKIIEFNYNNGEVKDWVFAPTVKEAKEFYVSLTDSDLNDNTKVSILPKKEWNNHYILDISEYQPDIYDKDDEDYVEWNEDDYHCGYKIESTFKEYAETHNKTDIIATTAY